MFKSCVKKRSMYPFNINRSTVEVKVFRYSFPIVRIPCHVQERGNRVASRKIFFSGASLQFLVRESCQGAICTSGDQGYTVLRRYEKYNCCIAYSMLHLSSVGGKTYRRGWQIACRVPVTDRVIGDAFFANVREALMDQISHTKQAPPGTRVLIARSPVLPRQFSYPFQRGTFPHTRMGSLSGHYQNFDR